MVSAGIGEWFDVSSRPVIGFLSGLRLNGNLNLKVEEIWTLQHPLAYGSIALSLCGIACSIAVYN